VIGEGNGGDTGSGGEFTGNNNEDGNSDPGTLPGDGVGGAGGGIPAPGSDDGLGGADGIPAPGSGGQGGA
jgi:hypothetical protein